MSAPARRSDRSVSPFSASPVNTFVNGTAELITLCAIKLLPQLFSRPKPRRMINTRELALRACFPQQSKQPSWVTRWFGAPSRSSKAGARNDMAAKMVSGALALDKGLQQLFSVLPGADAALPCLDQLTPEAIAQWAQARGAGVRWNGPGALKSALSEATTVIGGPGILDLLQSALNQCQSKEKLNGTRFRVDADYLLAYRIERWSGGKAVDAHYADILDTYEILKQLSEEGGHVIDIGEPYARRILEHVQQWQDCLTIDWALQTREDLTRLWGRTFGAAGHGVFCYGAPTALDSKDDPAVLPSTRDAGLRITFIVAGSLVGAVLVGCGLAAVIVKRREIGKCFERAESAAASKSRPASNDSTVQAIPRQHLSVFNPGTGQIEVEDDAIEMQKPRTDSNANRSDGSSDRDAESDSGDDSD